MKRAANTRTHATHGNVLDDLGFSPEEATALKFKAELYQAVLKIAKKYSQKELQRILAEPQHGGKSQIRTDSNNHPPGACA